MDRYEKFSDKPTPLYISILKGAAIVGIYAVVGTMSFLELTGGL